MESLRISVIIPTYNRADFLKRVSLPSVAAQTNLPLELIVVDDGSTDETATVVRQFADAHPELAVRYFHQKNAGVAAARNTGIAYAKGDWILALDSDDALMPEALDLLGSEAVRARADVVRGHTWRMSWQTGRVNGIGGSTPSSVLLSRAIFVDYGPYDEDRNIIEDVDHVFRLQPLIHDGTIKVPYIDMPVAIYYSHSGQVTNLATAEKLAVKAAAMIAKWEPIMPRTAAGRANMGRLWRNRGVYLVLAGKVSEGRQALARSFAVHPSLGTAILYICSLPGSWAFRHVILPLRAFGERLGFRLAFLRFRMRYGAKAYVLRDEARTVDRVARAA
ncbi:MAG TPA: glycosyltransferase family A protein [Candidatus Paceibacterota bacterium]|nr:glycosyltransferase family A protein [Candidatus Paceibacterota bacterium]